MYMYMCVFICVSLCVLTTFTFLVPFLIYGRRGMNLMLYSKYMQKSIGQLRTFKGNDDYEIMLLLMMMMMMMMMILDSFLRSSPPVTFLPYGLYIDTHTHIYIHTYIHAYTLCKFAHLSFTCSYDIYVFVNIVY